LVSTNLIFFGWIRGLSCHIVRIKRIYKKRSEVFFKPASSQGNAERYNIRIENKIKQKMFY